MIDVRWGNLGMKDEYLDWLSRKCLMAWITGIVFVLGSCIFLRLAFRDEFGFWQGLSLVGWVFLVTICGGVLSFVNRRLHNIENFIGFYQDRYQVRHQVYCTNHLHCLGTHYFNSFEENEPGNLT